MRLVFIVGVLFLGWELYLKNFCKLLFMVVKVIFELKEFFIE